MILKSLGKNEKLDMKGKLFTLLDTFYSKYFVFSPNYTKLQSVRE